MSQEQFGSLQFDPRVWGNIFRIVESDWSDLLSLMPEIPFGIFEDRENEPPGPSTVY